MVGSFEGTEGVVNKGGSLLTGIGIGLGLMFVLDPDRGRTRRALARNKIQHSMATADRAVGVTMRDASHRVEGVLAQLRVGRNAAVPDDILVLRIRSRIGRFVSHPHAIAVEVRNGLVGLTGPVLEGEVDGLVACVRSTPGVTDVENHLEVHRWAEDVPALQGGIQRRGMKPDILQDRWAPTTRAMVGVAGGAVILRGLIRGGPLAPIRGLVGSAMIARAVSNQPVFRTLGIGVGRRLVDFQKTFEIHAPIGKVWRLFHDVEDFPRVMAHILQVRKTGEGLYHWTVEGPLGMWFDFETCTTRDEPEHLLEWESLADSEMGMVGSIHMDETPSGGTRVDIKLSYHPPLGLLGHAIAWLSGADPHHAMNEDMIRVKSFLEEGKTTVRGKEITREMLRVSLAGEAAESEEARVSGEESQPSAS